jgi:hypothetical protein
VKFSLTELFSNITSGIISKKSEETDKKFRMADRRVENVLLEKKVISIPSLI